MRRIAHAILLLAAVFVPACGREPEVKGLDVGSAAFARRLHVQVAGMVEALGIT